MRLPEICIRRPVFASMMSAILVLFGIIGFTRLPVREFPEAESPVVNVNTVLRGANPQVMETTVTDVLEEELSTIPGVRTLTSASSEQSSSITLEFTLDRDIEAAAQDVRDKVSRVRGSLPQGIEEPVVTKQDSDAQPFFWLALRGENYDLLQLSDIGDRIVKTRLQSVPGVGRARIFGERRYSMRVWLNPEEMAARGLTVQDVEAAIQSRNVEIPAGRIESDEREFTVRSLGELKTPDEFGNLTVQAQDGQVVRLRDLARVELGPEDDRAVLRYKGVPAVAVGVIRQSKTNLVEVADRVHAELPAIQQALPPGVELVTAFDTSVFVRRSIDEAMETLVIAGILVVLIIFLFLRNLRATLIPGIAIPTSILAAFGLMYAAGFTINNLTLLALILAIGIVVDDAIIVMENAYRHQEELGEDPEEAAINGTNEITFAVVATTITLIAVFAPLLFLTGTIGNLFNEFGAAMGGAVVVSSFVALTLTPMLSAKILRVSRRHGRVYNTLESGFQKLSSGYSKTLGVAMRHRGYVVIGALATVLIAVFIFRALKREFVPPEDRGFFVSIVIAPEGSSKEYTDRYQRRVESILGNTDDIEGYFSIVGWNGAVNSGIVFSRLTDWDNRDRSVQDVVSEVQPQYFMIPGVFAFANNPPAFGFQSPVQFVVRHPDFDQLVAGMDALTSRAREIPGLINVDTNLRVNKPELLVEYDRDRAEDLGVPIRDVSSTLQTMLGGREVSTFTRDNKLYDVIMQLDPADRAAPSDMRGLRVRGRDGSLVSIDAVARIEESLGARQLNHYDRVRSFTLSANLAPDYTLGEAIDDLRAAADEVLPEGSTIALSGESRELEESGGALYFVFMLALIIVFMVLAAQFESLVHPFTVLLAVPLAVTGALATLWIVGSTLNLYSQIGMVLLIGIVTKNSILLVEYANQLVRRGVEPFGAALEAARIRFRPILMTAVATTMGAMPIALGLGAGSASRQPLGYAVVGGLVFSTALTLYLVPVVYTLMSEGVARVRGRTVVQEPSEGLGTAEAR